MSVCFSTSRTLLTVKLALVRRDVKILEILRPDSRSASAAITASVSPLLERPTSTQPQNLVKKEYFFTCRSVNQTMPSLVFIVPSTFSMTQKDNNMLLTSLFRYGHLLIQVNKTIQILFPQISNKHYCDELNCFICFSNTAMNLLLNFYY